MGMQLARRLQALNHGPCPAVESMHWGGRDWEPSRSMHERQLQCDTVSFNAAMKVLGDRAKQLLI